VSLNSALGRLAPELAVSKVNRVLVALTALFITGLVAAGTVLGLRLSESPQGLSQVQFHSTEVFGSAPGARIHYYPEKQTIVARGWLMRPLGQSGVYQVWAIEGEDFTSLGMADAHEFLGFTLIAPADLTQVDELIVTTEPPGGSYDRPTGPIVVTLVRGG
jgi:anti-sigma-K factor RskA